MIETVAELIERLQEILNDQSKNWKPDDLVFTRLRFGTDRFLIYQVNPRRDGIEIVLDSWSAGKEEL
jgi:hypothetical protein